MGCRQGLRRIHLALSKTGGADDTAGEFAIFHFQVGAQHVVYAQVGSGRFHLVGCGGRDNGHRVAFGQMRVHQRPRFRVDKARYLLGVELLAHLVIGLFLNTAHELGVNCHHAGETQVAQAKIGHGAHQLDEFPG